MATMMEPVQKATKLCQEVKRWQLRFTRWLIRLRRRESYGELRRFVRASFSSLKGPLRRERIPMRGLQVQGMAL